MSSRIYFFVLFADALLAKKSLPLNIKFQLIYKAIDKMFFLIFF